jgi:lipocalin
MSVPFVFDINKYMGIWYELIHYPSWFQRNDDYNTMAEYSLNSDGTIKVHNSTITHGKKFESYGIARRINDNSLRVDFPVSETIKLTNSQEFKTPENVGSLNNSCQPNYVIDKIWVNMYGEYIFAIITDLNRQSLYVLSRYKHPSLISYNQIMTYVINNYDRDRLVQTPQFD